MMPYVIQHASTQPDIAAAIMTAREALRLVHTEGFGPCAQFVERAMRIWANNPRFRVAYRTALKIETDAV
jgi:hypothetical protein